MVLVFGTRQTLRMFVGSSDLLGTREARQPVFDGKFELLEPYNLKRVEPAERAQLLKPRIKPLVTREQSEELVGPHRMLPMLGSGYVSPPKTLVLARHIRSNVVF